MSQMSRTEQIVFAVAFLALLAALVFATWFSPTVVPAPVAQQLSGIGVRDVGTPGLMTSTPAATSTPVATSTSISGEALGVSQGGVRSGYAASWSSGTPIVHGLKFAPKACTWNFISGTAITSTAMISDTTSFTITAPAASAIPLMWICSQ